MAAPAAGAGARPASFWLLAAWLRNRVVVADLDVPAAGEDRTERHLRLAG